MSKAEEMKEIANGVLAVKKAEMEVATNETLQDMLSEIEREAITGKFVTTFIVSHAIRKVDWGIIAGSLEKDGFEVSCELGTLYVRWG